jgi:hypothetical protein
MMSLNRQEILAEIKRVTLANGNVPPGQRLFSSKTGIKEHEWLGRFWANWSDALLEAGYKPNKWKEGYSEAFLTEKIICLTRQYGRFPTQAEIKLKGYNDPEFPSIKPFRRLGSKNQIIEKVRDYCQANQGYDDVLALCQITIIAPASERLSSRTAEPENGFVYLIKSGRFYKIGRSVSVGQRERQLAIQLPEKVNTVHSIRTDDPVGIEAYWHKRFETRRKNGEWFDLSADDVRAFKRRKFM